MSFQRKAKVLTGETHLKLICMFKQSRAWLGEVINLFPSSHSSNTIIILWPSFSLNILHCSDMYLLHQRKLSLINKEPSRHFHKLNEKLEWFVQNHSTASNNILRFSRTTFQLSKSQISVYWEDCAAPYLGVLPTQINQTQICRQGSI